MPNSTNVNKLNVFLKSTIFILLASRLTGFSELIFRGQIHGHSMNQRVIMAGGSESDFIPLINAPVPSIIDPARVVNGIPVSTLGDGWMLFYGRVVDETNRTVIVQGSFSHDPVLLKKLWPPQEFAVVGFPYHFNVGDSIPTGDENNGFYSAMIQPRAWLVLNGTNYNAVLNYHVLPDYTYHKPSATRQMEINRRMLAALLVQATNGDASAEYILGTHYLKGDLGETNKVLGSLWIKIAADSGDVDASNKLASISL
jgi:hypothetical protein